MHPRLRLFVRRTILVLVFLAGRGLGVDLCRQTGALHFCLMSTPTAPGDGTVDAQAVVVGQKRAHGLAQSEGSIAAKSGNFLTTS
jgi:hypothetical protein